jgi:hypothetical protein
LVRDHAAPVRLRAQQPPVLLPPLNSHRIFCPSGRVLSGNDAYLTCGVCCSRHQGAGRVGSPVAVLFVFLQGAAAKTAHVHSVHRTLTHFIHLFDRWYHRRCPLVLLWMP